MATNKALLACYGQINPLHFSWKSYEEQKGFCLAERLAVESKLSRSGPDALSLKDLFN